MKQMDYHRRKVQTSTTIGLEYLQPSPFYFKTCKNAPLPPVLQRQDRVPASSHFSLTSHSEHDRKPLNGPLYNEICSKAPPHWTTHFLNELAQRLRDHPTVRVISNPISEMQHQYRGQLAASEPLGEHYSKIQGLYRQLETTQAFVQEPVRSTTKTDFKRFHRSDLSSRSVLDAATFNGKLTKSGAHSRLPAHKAPSTLSCQPRLPRPPLPLPHRGKSTLYMDSFTVPVPPPTSQAAGFAQSGGKWEEDDGGRDLFLDVLGVPKMYSTENQTYGTNKTSMV